MVCSLTQRVGHAGWPVPGPNTRRSVVLSVSSRSHHSRIANSRDAGIVEFSGCIVDAQIESSRYPSSYLSAVSQMSWVWARVGRDSEDQVVRRTTLQKHLSEGSCL